MRAFIILAALSLLARNTGQRDCLEPDGGEVKDTLRSCDGVAGSSNVPLDGSVIDNYSIDDRLMGFARNSIVGRWILGSRLFSRWSDRHEYTSILLQI